MLRKKMIIPRGGCTITDASRGTYLHMAHYKKEKMQRSSCVVDSLWVAMRIWCCVHHPKWPWGSPNVQKPATGYNAAEVKHESWGRAISSCFHRQPSASWRAFTTNSLEHHPLAAKMQGFLPISPSISYVVLFSIPFSRRYGSVN